MNINVILVSTSFGLSDMEKIRCPICSVRSGIRTKTPPKKLYVHSKVIIYEYQCNMPNCRHIFWISK